MKQRINFPLSLRIFFISVLFLGLLGRNDPLFSNPQLEAQNHTENEVEERNGKSIQIPKLHYYATVADAYHYPYLMNLIGSIHKVDFDDLGEIAVFDIGLNSEQLNKLDNIKKTKVYQVEKTHPNLFDYNLTHPNAKKVRG